MKKTVLLLVLAALVLAPARLVSAVEPVIEFVDGLRSRGYYDTAEEYLDRIENDPRIPLELRKRVPYERALILNDSARNDRSAEIQQRKLDRAAAELDRFIKTNPGHALQGDAQSLRGNIFLGKARVAILESQSPVNASRRPQLRKQALQFILEARKIFTAARSDHEKRWKAFPVFIPPEQKKQLQARKDAEVKFMMAQIDLALTTYEEAQVYKADYEKQKERTPKNRADTLTKHPYYTTLDKAAREFAEIHSRYRSQVAGLYARMWQGKCFEEQDEIGRALGIYKELLDHPGTSRTLQNLQRQVLSFKLICLNHDKRRDYYLVEQDATAWLNKNRRYWRTPSGLRIRFELARAREKLGLNPDLPEKERNRYLRLARQDAEFVNRFPGKFKDATTLMLSRIKRSLGIATEDPTSFPDAYSAAQIAYAKIKTLQSDLQKAKADRRSNKDLQTLQGRLSDQMERTERLFRLSLKLAKPGDNPDHVNRARYILAYVYFLQDRLFRSQDPNTDRARAYDAAVLAEFVARVYKEQAPDTARDAAYLAMAAYISLYNQAPASRRRTEMRWIIRIARYIIDTWPASDRAVDAAFKLGDMYNQQERYLLAARWYSRIPSTATDQYALSLLNAGTNYWGHYSIAAGLPPEKETYRSVLQNSVGEDWADALADRLNPSWNAWQRLQRLDEIDRLIAAQGPVPHPSAAPAQGPKKNSGKNRATKVSRKQAASSKPRGGAKKKSAKNSPPKKQAAPQSTDSPRKKEIRKLQAQSKQELQLALSKLSGRPADQFKNQAEADLRKLLLRKLNDLPPAKLQAEVTQQLDGLSQAELTALFRSKLSQWRTLAGWYLAHGIRVMQAQLSPDSETPEDLVRAKLALAEYVIGEENFRYAIRLLGEIDAGNPPPHTVLAAIRVKDQSRRANDRSVTGRDFASAVYQTLAIAYIGANQLDRFRLVMKALKAIVAGGKAEDLTELYQKLGRQLQKEIERLKNQGDEQALKAKRDIFRRAFETLLEGEDQLDFNLLMWIGEASYALGAGLGDPSQAIPYFEQAAKAYQLALGRNRGLSEDQRLAVQLRLLNCRRRQTRFSEALDLAKSVIAKRPNLLPAQVEAAYTLQDWGRKKDPEKFREARKGSKFQGDSGTFAIWGWEELGDRLLEGAGRYRKKADRAETADYKDFFERYLTARYNLTWCLYRYGLSQTDPPKRQQALTDARRELAAFGRNQGDIDEANWKLQDPLTGKRVDAKAHFENLYLAIQKDLGIAENDRQQLKWGFRELLAGRRAKAAKVAKLPLPTASPAQAEQAPETKAAASGPWGTILGIVFLLGGLGLGGWFVYHLKTQDRKRRSLYAYTTGGSGFQVATGRSKDSRSRSPGQVQRQPSSRSQSPAATMPAATTEETQRKRGRPPSGKAPRRQGGPPPRPPG